jgi:predicted signal transduction protein with EAL and GGDEF domain
LSHLRRLPAGELKIDQSFVAGMLDAPRDATIVASTIDLARRLGLRAVAEGVEDADTLAALSELGCDQVQGYFVSRPLPADQLHEWLSGRRARSVRPAEGSGRHTRAPAAPSSSRRSVPDPPLEPLRLRSAHADEYRGEVHSAPPGVAQRLRDR